MEIQIPLVLFVALCATSAGIFATQAILALKGEGKELQLPSLIASFVALALGGVAVLFHLARPLHIFNGFGNPTSGITQELIVIVILVVMMLIYFIMLRRNDSQVPVWCAICAIVIAVVLDLVCANSYMMSSRPGWDSALQMLSVVGGSCAVGPAIVAMIAGFKNFEVKSLGKITLVGTIVGLVLTLAYIIFLTTVGGAFTTMGTYMDPTNPTAALFNAKNITPFSAEAMLPTCVAIIAGALAIVFAWFGYKKGNWKVNGTVAAFAALVSIIALRVVFYILGACVFPFYGITG